MKRPLIEIEQESLVQCDSPGCNYSIPNSTGNPNERVDEYLNTPCPECGKNLLTIEDLHRYKKMLSIVNFLNRWFSWLNIFSSKKSKYRKIGHYHTKTGFTLNDDIDND